MWVMYQDNKTNPRVPWRLSVLAGQDFIVEGWWVVVEVWLASSVLHEISIKTLILAGSGEVLKKKERYLRWPSCILDRNYLSYFSSPSRIDAPCHFSSNLTNVREESYIHFQNCHSDILDFRSELFQRYYTYHSSRWSIPSRYINRIDQTVSEKSRIDFQHAYLSVLYWNDSASFLCTT